MDPKKDSELWDVLRTQRLAVLSTKGAEYPYPSLVAFAAGKDARELFFVTKKGTHKHNNLKRDPRVSLLISNATGRVKDFDEATAVTGLGEVVEVPDDRSDRVRELFLEKIPSLTEFADDPQSVFVGVVIHKYIIVSKFQEVRELKVSKQG